MVLPLALFPALVLASGGGAEGFRVERDCLGFDFEAAAFLPFDGAGALCFWRRIRPPSSSSSSSRWVVSKAVASSSSSSSDDMSYSVRWRLGCGLCVRLGRRARRVAVDIAVGFLVVLLRVLAGSGGGGDSCVRGSA